uniref:THAP-type domain-containing protein n=1 Tax=Photinus pyralis TaxID=7054 RepID=A0A1Y1KDZ1_PHOPY
MPGTACYYFNCNKKKSDFPFLRMFRIPVKDTQQTKQWIINCGRINLFIMEPKQVHSKYICEHHFAVESFMDPQHRHRLMPHAIPLHYSDSVSSARKSASAKPLLKVRTPTKVYQKKDSSFLSTPPHCSSPEGGSSNNIEEDMQSVRTSCKRPLTYEDIPKEKKLKTHLDTQTN